MTIDTILPAGKYYIGDPCYVFSGKYDLWGQVLEASDYLEVPCDLPNIKIWAASTKYGDGQYATFDYTFSVDSGCIGIVPMETVEFVGADISFLEKCGAFITFKKDSRILFEDGVFAFGAEQCIDTNDPDESDDYCHHYDENDED